MVTKEKVACGRQSRRSSSHTCLNACTLPGIIIFLQTDGIILDSIENILEHLVGEVASIAYSTIHALETFNCHFAVLFDRRIVEVGVQHNDTKRKDKRRVSSGKYLRVLVSVSCSEDFHDTINLLRFTRKTEATQIVSNSLIKVHSLEIQFFTIRSKNFQCKTTLPLFFSTEKVSNLSFIKKIFVAEKILCNIYRIVGIQMSLF
mmetsp:Transcript_11276/g.17002  ORF Transcript_11276/g.17002 Transcript_11276/m.17002 type:complete len:204 (-) Transcript_11276:244-855(-)